MVIEKPKNIAFSRNLRPDDGYCRAQLTTCAPLLPVAPPPGCVASSTDLFELLSHLVALKVTERWSVPAVSRSTYYRVRTVVSMEGTGGAARSPTIHAHFVPIPNAGCAVIRWATYMACGLFSSCVLPMSMRH